jgi:hypothetical protein
MDEYGDVLSASIVDGKGLRNIRLTNIPLYTAPPQRQPLTQEEIWREYQALWPFHPQEEPRLAADMATFARAIERAHGIGGGE